MRKIYEIEIDEEDVTGVDFLGFVSQPAHGKKWIAFNDEVKPQYFTSDEEQVVRGVMISANKLIPRYDKQEGKYDVFFSPSTIKDIIYKFFKNGFIANVNSQHDPTQILEGVYLYESYQVDGINTLPDAAIGSKVGDWVAAYKITSPEVWADVKAGAFYGFSVEGFFNHKKGTFNKNINKMNNEKKSLKDKVLALFNEEDKAKFGEVSTVDGLVISYEGETLEPGVALTTMVNDEMVALSEGVYALTGEGYEGKSLVVDANGVLVEVTETVAEDAPEEVAEAIEAIVEQMQKQEARFNEALEAVKEDFSAKLEAFKSENEELKAKVAKFEAKPQEAPKTKFKTENKPTLGVDANPLLAKYLNK